MRVSSPRTGYHDLYLEVGLLQPLHGPRQLHSRPCQSASLGRQRLSSCSAGGRTSGYVPLFVMSPAWINTSPLGSFSVQLCVSATHTIRVRRNRNDDDDDEGIDWHGAIVLAESSLTTARNTTRVRSTYTE